eukprot:1137464-Pelagomonas_calceolata.AAC.5
MSERSYGYNGRNTVLSLRHDGWRILLRPHQFGLQHGCSPAKSTVQACASPQITKRGAANQMGFMSVLVFAHQAHSLLHT